MNSTTSRRKFLKAATLSSALFGTSSPFAHAQETRKSNDNRGVPKKVIFMVSDGMNHGALSLAQHSRALFDRRTTHWMQLYQEKPAVRALVETFSANSIVTDSAAAASAWGGGQRVDNGTINIDPASGKPIAPLQSLLKERGIPTGLVSTATITHATPAGFAANTPTRGDQQLIAQQYHQRGVEVLLGGGRQFFPGELLRKFSKDGYQILNNRRELLDAKNPRQPLLGLFSPGHIPLAIDREAQKNLQETVPSLAEMAQIAVGRLDTLTSGQWFLMVEGARIDHCGHANDACGSIREQLAFDDAIGAMLAYAATREDVLVIITTDHGCGGIQLNGVNARPDQGMAPGIYTGTTPAFKKIAGFNRSFEWLANAGSGLSGPPLRDYLAKHTGIALSKDELKMAQGLKGNVLADIFGRHHGITWTGGNHTADLAEFCAYGPGSHQFPGFMKNTDVHGHLLRALAIA
ncbi:MAG: alkaline phosphatase [Akkermansiaceae bacterium]|nr:alkaline phosphatase [Akkermansiaceae bacterium]